jgi:hypothetical protein
VSSHSNTISRIRILAVTALSLLGAWLVISHTFAAYLAPWSPERALLLDPSNPVALLALARKEIDVADGKAGVPIPVPEATETPDMDTDSAASGVAGVETSRIDVLRDLAIETAKAGTPDAAPATLGPISPTKIEALAQRVRERDPLNARAMRLLAEVAEANGDTGKANVLMRAATRHSLRESTALAWLMEKSFERKDYASAMTFADALIRTRPQTRQPIVARLAEAAQSKLGNAAVKALLATNPPWRGSFFTVLPTVVTDARAPLDLLLSLKDTPAPPSSADLNSYLNFLVSRKLHEVAYAAWLQFLDPEDLAIAGFVYNGGFEKKASGMPFDWAISPGAGVTTAIEPLSEKGGAHGLSILFGQGRVDFKPVKQVTMLPPGEYTFSVRTKGQMSGRRGLLWRIACAEKPSVPLAQSPDALGKAASWKPVEFSFTIPQSGCISQLLKLELDARSASEQFVSGSVWYDDVAITRKGAPENPG